MILKSLHIRLFLHICCILSTALQHFEEHSFSTIGDVFWLPKDLYKFFNAAKKIDYEALISILKFSHFSTRVLSERTNNITSFRHYKLNLLSKKWLRLKSIKNITYTKKTGRLCNVRSHIMFQNPLLHLHYDAEV